MKAHIFKVGQSWTVLIRGGGDGDLYVVSESNNLATKEAALDLARESGIDILIHDGSAITSEMAADYIHKSDVNL